MMERERQRDRERDADKGFRALGGFPPKELEALALGLWEGLSHSALLCLIVIVLKVVSAKTNWRKKTYGIQL